MSEQNPIPHTAEELLEQIESSRASKLAQWQEEYEAERSFEEAELRSGGAFRYSWAREITREIPGHLAASIFSEAARLLQHEEENLEPGRGARPSEALQQLSPAAAALVLQTASEIREKLRGSGFAQEVHPESGFGPESTEARLDLTQLVALLLNPRSFQRVSLEYGNLSDSEHLYSAPVKIQIKLDPEGR